MADADLAFAGIARQAQMLRDGGISSRELTGLYLDRIARIDPELNAFRVVLAERAIAAAEDADRRLAAGEEAPLLGVPIALKDEFADLEGELTTIGTDAFDEPAAADAELTRRLRGAGAVILGKTNLPELAITGFTESRTWGITRNPWHRHRTPGGSSGGSAAAVAAGLVGAATGSDGAGSIRIPAANCGLFGLKPQYGRVPLAPYPGHWRGLSVHGFLTRSVRDTALLLDVGTAGGGDPGGPPPPARAFTEAAATPPGRLRVALSTEPQKALLPPVVADEVSAALSDAGELLRSLGHRVVEDDPGYGLVVNFLPRYLGGIRDEVRTLPHPERLERRTRGFARLGACYPPPVRELARRRAAADARRINRILERHDVLVTPTVGVPPVEIGRWEGRSALRTLAGMARIYCFTAVWNHTGQPAAAVPVGFTDDGLPLSVQLVGRPNDEQTLLSLAAQIEAERPWADRRPPVS